MERNLGASTACLIIGGRGFIGSAIAQAARDAGWKVTAVARDDYARQVGQRFDVVVNANGNARRFKANNEPLWDFDSSVRPVYQSLFDFEFTHYALISSVDVYNDPTTPAATAEDTPIDLARLPAYGFHKRLAELCVMRQAGSWQVFRLAQMVGPDIKKGPLFDLLEGLPLWIHPAARLHYISTRTAADIIVRLIERAPRNQVYNVCGRDSVEFSRVLDLFGRTADNSGYAARERQTYGINTDKTHRLCPLPDSWSEVRTFVEAAQAARTAR
jgi:nucleoside-diphosphate-sugar epimerase